MQRDTASQQEVPTDPFDTALRAFVDTYKTSVHKDWAAKILRNTAEQILHDPTWVYAGDATEPATAAVLTLLQPSSAVIGDPDVTLEVMGTGLTAESKIFFNGGEEVTTYVDETKVTTIVKPSTASVATTVSVEVHNADQVSNSLSFAFTDVAARSRLKTE